MYSETLNIVYNFIPNYRLKRKQEPDILAIYCKVNYTINELSCKEDCSYASMFCPIEHNKARTCQSQCCKGKWLIPSGNFLYKVYVGHSTDSRSNPDSLKFSRYAKLCVTNTRSQGRVIDAFFCIKS